MILPQTCIIIGENLVYVDTKFCRVCEKIDITSYARDHYWYDTCEKCEYKIKCKEDAPKNFQARIERHMIEFHWLLYYLSFGTYRCSENCHCIKP